MIDPMDNALPQTEPFAVDIISTNPRIKKLLVDRVAVLLSDPSLNAELDAILEEDAGRVEEAEATVERN